MGNIIPEGTGEEEEVVSDEDDNHFLSNPINVNSLPTEGISIETEEKPCVVYPPDASAPPSNPAAASTAKEKVMNEVPQQQKSGIDYKGIWMNNSMPSLIVQINSGKLLKGNTFFMKWWCGAGVRRRLFQFASMEQLNQLSFFDIITPDDLSLFWRCVCGVGVRCSEYSQLVNAQHQMSRAFVCTIKNPMKNVGAGRAG